MSNAILFSAAPAAAESVTKELQQKERKLVKPAAALSYGHARAQLAAGLNLIIGMTPREAQGTTQGATRVTPLALPFCAPWLEQGETVVAVDGANCFNLYRLTEWAKRKRLDSPGLLQRLRIARAFTPFQMATILHHIGAEMRRSRARRLVITGLPDCLYDEELSEQEARGTFARCRRNLLQLAEQHTVVAFSDAPEQAAGSRRVFLDALAGQARLVLEAGESETEAAHIHHFSRFSFVPLKAPGLLTVETEAEEADEA